MEARARSNSSLGSESAVSANPVGSVVANWSTRTTAAFAPFTFTLTEPSGAGVAGLRATRGAPQLAQKRALPTRCAPHVPHVLAGLQSLKSAVTDNFFLFYFPYAAGLVAVSGRTIGMMVLDLRVVGLNHERITILQSVIRYGIACAMTVSVIPLMMSFFRRVQFQDQWSGTRLIGNRSGLR